MNKTIVALDCMGGDYAPKETVKGAVEALKENKNIFVKLYGKEDEINAELKKFGNLDDIKDSFEIIDAPEVIEMGDSPVAAIRNKSESSLVKAMYDVRHGNADGLVSAGSTGANLVGGHVIIGRLKGVERPPLAPLIPTTKAPVLLIDSGANVDARAAHLVQFAIMGTVYVENVLGIECPRVGLLNIGTEEEKGNSLTKETYELLKNTKGINFIGNVEARDVPEGVCDVCVCDAFVGNIFLKTFEGTAKTLFKQIKSTMMTNLKTKIGGLLIKKELKNTLKKYDVKEHGGAPMLGLKGLLVKTHGNSEAVEIKNSIIQCATFNELNINDKILERLDMNKEKE